MSTSKSDPAQTHKLLHEVLEDKRLLATWTGNANDGGLWATEGNWDGRVPHKDGDAIFSGASSNVRIDAIDAESRRLVFESGSTTIDLDGKPLAIVGQNFMDGTGAGTLALGTMGGADAVLRNSRPGAPLTVASVRVGRVGREVAYLVLQGPNLVVQNSEGNTDAVVGDVPLSNGIVEAKDGAQWIAKRIILGLGRASTGEVLIFDGGNVSAKRVTVGANETASGLLRIIGTGSKLKVPLVEDDADIDIGDIDLPEGPGAPNLGTDGEVSVGARGRGELFVLDGGVLESKELAIGGSSRFRTSATAHHFRTPAGIKVTPLQPGRVRLRSRLGFGIQASGEDAVNCRMFRCT